MTGFAWWEVTAAVVVTAGYLVWAHRMFRPNQWRATVMVNCSRCGGPVVLRSSYGSRVRDRSLSIGAGRVSAVIGEPCRCGYQP